MTGTTTEGILEGKPEEKQKKKETKLKRWDEAMNKSKGQIKRMDRWVERVTGSVYRKEGGRLRGCSRTEHRNLPERDKVMREEMNNTTDENHM